MKYSPVRGLALQQLRSILVTAGEKKFPVRGMHLLSNLRGNFNFEDLLRVS